MVTVSLRYRMRVQLKCVMNLQYFPMDHQDCKIHLESCKLYKLIAAPRTNIDSDFHSMICREIQRQLCHSKMAARQQ